MSHSEQNPSKSSKIYLFPHRCTNPRETASERDDISKQKNDFSREHWTPTQTTHYCSCQTTCSQGSINLTGMMASLPAQTGGWMGLIAGLGVLEKTEISPHREFPSPQPVTLPTEIRQYPLKPQQIV
jgi:hypothetical protein